jgi:hypothetical protein
MENISKALVLFVCLSIPIVGRVPPSFSACDINQDGTANVVDIQLILDEALQRTPATNDLNGDGFVNVVDVEIEITAALGVGCLAGPQTFAIRSGFVSVENTTPVAPTGPMTYEAVGVPVSVENATPVAPTGPMTYVAVGVPVSVENSVPVAPTGPMTYMAVGVPFSMLNSVSPAPLSPQTYYISGLDYSIFNGLTAGSFLTAASAPSLRFRVPVDPAFMAEALARGARRIDGKPACVDSDGDGLCDDDELIIGTSPYLADSDGDGYPDGLELALGSDPLDPRSIPDIRPPGYFATPPVSMHSIIPVAILTPRTQGVVHDADNR